MATVGELVVVLRGDGSKLAATLDDGSRKVRKFAAESQQGFRKVENAMVTLGAQAVGLEGQWGRLSEGMLLLGVGGAVTLAVTGGILAVTKLMKLAGDGAEDYRDKLDAVKEKYHKLAVAAREASRTEILIGQANLEQELKKASVPFEDRDPLAQFKILGRSSIMPGKTQAERIAVVLNRDRATILNSLAEIDAALQAFDTRVREREERDKPKEKKAADPYKGLPKNLLTSPLYQATKIAANKRIAELRDQNDPFDNLDKIFGKIDRDTEAAAKAITAKLDPSIVALAEKTQLWRDITAKATADANSSFERFFYNLQTRGLSAFRVFIGEIIDMWQQMLAKLAADQIGKAIGLNTLISGITGGLSGLGSGVTGPGGETSLPGSTVNVQLQVYAIDAPGVQRFFQANRQEVGRQVVDLMRSDSQFAALLRGN